MNKKDLYKPKHYLVTFLTEVYVTAKNSNEAEELASKEMDLDNYRVYKVTPIR